MGLHRPLCGHWFVFRIVRHEGLCCKIRVLGVLNPFRGFPLRDSVGDGDSERGEAVEYGDTDVKLCDLTVKIPC